MTQKTGELEQIIQSLENYKHKKKKRNRVRYAIVAAAAIVSLIGYSAWSFFNRMDEEQRAFASLAQLGNFVVMADEDGLHKINITNLGVWFLITETHYGVKSPVVSSDGKLLAWFYHYRDCTTYPCGPEMSKVELYDLVQGKSLAGIDVRGGIARLAWPKSLPNEIAIELYPTFSEARYAMYHQIPFSPQHGKALSLRDKTWKGIEQDDYIFNPEQLKVQCMSKGWPLERYVYTLRCTERDCSLEWEKYKYFATRPSFQGSLQLFYGNYINHPPQMTWAPPMQSGTCGPEKR